MDVNLKSDDLKVSAETSCRGRSLECEAAETHGGNEVSDFQTEPI